MGLISSVFAQFFNVKKQMKILMLGLDGAGKTTILYRLKLNKFITTIPSTGPNLETIEHKNISFAVWDIADSTDRYVLEEVVSELYKMLSYKEFSHANLLLLLNKQDMPGAMSSAELTEKLELDSIKNRKWFIQATSATQGTGLYEGLDWLTEELQSR